MLGTEIDKQVNFLFTFFSNETKRESSGLRSKASKKWTRALRKHNHTAGVKCFTQTLKAGRNGNLDNMITDC